MNTAKEKWKDEVMDSLTKMGRAEPNPFLLTRIKERIKAPEENVGFIQPAYFKLALACVTMLFILNISLVVKTTRTQDTITDSSYTSSSFLQNFNLYE